MLRAAGALGRSFVWGAKRPWLGGIVAMGKRRGSDLPVEEHEERTGLPVIAILGQPNVGKSTLFNCFVRLFSGKFKNSSIVTNIPGTTRDRIYAFLEVPAEDRTHITRFMLIDTGGISSTSTRVPDAHNAVGRIDELIREQAFIAMEQANAVIYIADVSKGITQTDRRLASWMRKKYKGVVEDRVILVVNKVDNDERADQVAQFVRLGLGEPVSCSAAHSAGISEVFYKALQKMIKYRHQPIALAQDEAVAERLRQKEQMSEESPSGAASPVGEGEGEAVEEGSEVEEVEENEEDYQIPWESLLAKDNLHNIADFSRLATNQSDLQHYKEVVRERSSLDEPDEMEDNGEVSQERPRTLKLAILGRPNVGKSSILNAIVGKNRAIVSNVAGTTHDPIDEKITWRGETDILLVDTAGIRRKGHHKIGIESLTILWAMQIIERSEVVLLVVDAKEGILRQDKRLASEALERNRSVIVVVNKWDGKVRRKNSLEDFEKYVRKELNFLNFVPVVFASAMNKENLEPVIDLSVLVGQQRRQRIPTRKLMDIVKNMDHRGPGSKKRHMKIKFISQARVQSPTFAVFASNVDLCTESYKRYVENCIRARFPFTGTPIRLIVTDPPTKTTVHSGSRKFKRPLPASSKRPTKTASN